MVFTKPLQYARLGLQKAIPHGGPQSLVAASQSSSVPHQTSAYLNRQTYSAKAGPSHSHPHIHHAATPSAGNGFGLKPTPSDGQHTDGGLAAYYAAWQRHQRKPKDDDWQQFQFAKRLEWKAPTTIPEPGHEAKLAVNPQHQAKLVLERSHSANALHDIKADPALEAAAQAEFNDAIAKEIESIRQSSQEAEAAAASADVSHRDDTPVLAATSRSSESFESTTASHSTKATSVSEVDQYADQLDQLASQQQYGDIPAIFQQMLNEGVNPTASTYNSLLQAAVHLPRASHQVVPKVLDVYTDMLRRKVMPNAATYDILIELLASRSLAVRAKKEQLEHKLGRYAGLSSSGSHLFGSDNLEAQIISEDDSLTLALQFFDAAIASHSTRNLSSDTFGRLLDACARQDRAADISKILEMFGTQTIASEVRAPIMNALARNGDVAGAVSIYEVYKGLAIASDRGEFPMERNDALVYAAVVNAYALNGQMERGLKFMRKIEDVLANSDQLQATRDVIGCQALIPAWIQSGNYNDAIEHAGKVSPAAALQAYSSICVGAADKGDTTAALQAFHHSRDIESITAVLAMHLRQGNFQAASEVFDFLRFQKASSELIEPYLAFSLGLINSGNFEHGIGSMNQLFAALMRGPNKAPDTIERAEEAVGILISHVLKRVIVPPPSVGLELLRLMSATGVQMSSDTERVLASFGPHDISLCSPGDVDMLAHTQASVLATSPSLDGAQVERLMHLAELATRSGSISSSTSKSIDYAVSRIGRPETSARWYNIQHPAPMTPISPLLTRHTLTPAPSVASFASSEHYDPYESSTDIKGSIFIGDILDKSYGQHAAHFNEAMSRFKNMRRIGRHPRYVTYAKLIGAAAKENRLSLAQEILAMAKRDVPLVPDSRVVRHGWVSILDAMVAACLTVGRRELASQYHLEMTNMGAAPSANTFGLYITTLKESTKTFDEATEAVKIFHRAKAEGVEPSSFLYNALIGKLGKARRIDDCLFYFAEMRTRGIRPTSVTYGTIVNALCRVSDDRFAEELFEEMESMPNYKPRPAPYNSMMQYFLTTKRDRSKVLSYYERMRVNNIEPTMHTYKLLIDTYATLEPVDMAMAEGILEGIRAAGKAPEAVHYASLIHAKGCVTRDLEGARALFDRVISSGLAPPQASLYQALFESMVANHAVEQTIPLVDQMYEQGVAMTAYIANTLIHGWATVKDIVRAKAIFENLGMANREPSTYEAMTRAYLIAEDHGNAKMVVGEALRRGYPSAVANRICELVTAGENAEASATA